MMMNTEIKQMIHECAYALAQELGPAIRRHVIATLVDGTSRSTTTKSYKIPAPRSMDCIATGCGGRSKGPRFRYLCERHVAASVPVVMGWRKAKAAERIAEKKAK